MVNDQRVDEVLSFWFGPEPGTVRAEWFRKDSAFDALIGARFGPLVEAAVAGEIDAWMGSPLGALARLIVLDQFTRNTGRDSARAFAGDVRALAAAQAIVRAGWDLDYSGVQRWFCYLPFEHAEDLAEQQASLRLFGALAKDQPALAPALDYAQRHHAVIERFGRFPHRNAALGRPSTPQEVAYLQQPGAGF